MKQSIQFLLLLVIVLTIVLVALSDEAEVERECRTLGYAYGIIAVDGHALCCSSDECIGVTEARMGWDD